MNNDVSAPSVLVEGSALPPARAFGESTTLTVPRPRRRRSSDDFLGYLASAASATDAAGHVHLAVVPSDSTPITLTL